MAIDDDPLSVSLRQAKFALDHDIERDLRQASIAGILSLIPGVGSAIQSLLEGKAQRNVERRWVQLFADLKENVEEIRDSIPDQDYYSSEEFQSLLAQAYQQLIETHDRVKLRMLAAALANSGTSAFKADDKEVYIRVLRSLSTFDLETLNDERLKGWFPHTHEINYSPEVLSSLSRLAGQGLVLEKLKRKAHSGSTTGSARMDAQRAFQDLVIDPPTTVYLLSPLGGRFLKFVSTANGK
jgi:hypothetical protein